jgi:microcystin-dependent protein
MSQPYIGEIRMFGGNFAPAGWMFCAGQLIPISENDALFQLIGTTYGGDGQETFALPDLQGRIPIHMGTAPSGANYQIGEKAGVESVTLNTQQIPMHTHALLGSTGNGSQTGPAGNVLSTSTVLKPYGSETPDALMAANSIGIVGGSQPHENLQPYLCVSFIISLYGVYPSPT